MLPYSEYIFDITDVAKEKDNELLVLIEDTTPVFGPSEGWENYGGIIRGVALLYANASYIKDVFFSATIENEYKNGKFKVALDGVFAEGDFWRVSLLDGEKQTLVLKNGEDVTTALGAFGPSRINPIAENSVRLARFHFDIDFENYVMNGREIPLQDKSFTEIEIKSENNGYDLMVYGLYL